MIIIIFIGDIIILHSIILQNKMNRIKLLVERHQFREGNLVSVYSRNAPDKIYHGTIVRIINKRENSYDKFSPYVDHFYISFDKSVYDTLLQPASKVIYNGSEITLGDIERNAAGKITKVFRQYDFATFETDIDIDKIDALLIWRVKFAIE